jgi:hypothetical protein
MYYVAKQTPRGRPLISSAPDVSTGGP